MAISKAYLTKTFKSGIDKKVSSMVKKGYRRSKKKSKNRSLEIANKQQAEKESREQAQKTQTSIIDKTRASKINYKTGLIEGEYAKTGIGEKLLTGKGLFAEGQEVAKGTVPIGPAGGGFKDALAKIGKGKAGAIWKGTDKMVKTSKVLDKAKYQSVFKGGFFSKAASGGTGIVANIKNELASLTLLQKLGIGTTAAVGITTTVGTYPFAKFEMAEANDKIGIAMFRAAEEGDDAMVLELQQYAAEMNDPSTWDKILSTIPWANVHKSASVNIAAAQVSNKAQGDLALRNLERVKNGETEADMWLKIEDDKAARELERQEKFRADNLAAEEAKRLREIKYREEDQQDYRDEDDARRKLRKEERNRDSKFYKEQAAAARELELAQMEADALFYDEQRRIWIKYQEEMTGRSSLSFGLFR